MNKYQQKAWDCLTPTEQQSLFLQLSESKSSWEAGEILRLSHYKYLEIKERSESPKYITPCKGKSFVASRYNQSFLLLQGVQSSLSETDSHG